MFELCSYPMAFFDRSNAYLSHFWVSITTTLIQMDLYGVDSAMSKCT